MSSRKLRGIYQRGNIFWLTRGSGARRLQVSLETTDYAEAISKAQTLLASPLLNPSAGFKADLDRFAAEQTQNRVWTKNSRSSKSSVLTMFGEDQGWPPLPRLTISNIQQWYDQQVARTTVVTANGYMTVVKAFLNWAVAQRITSKNPAADVKLRKAVGSARVKYCTFEQRNTILAGAPTDELRFIFYCGFYAGFRKNEIIEARPDWFDLELQHVHVKTTAAFMAKGKEERTIPMAKEFCDFLKRFGLRTPFMIQPTVVQGKARYRYDFRKPFEEYLKRIGFGWVTPHVMRHTFASLLVSSNCSVYKVAQWLGDTLATTEKHYAHLIKSDPDIELLNGAGRDNPAPAKKSRKR